MRRGMRLTFKPERSSATHKSLGLLRQPLRCDVIRQCGSNSLLLREARSTNVQRAFVVFAALPSHQLALILGVTSGFFLFTATGDLLPDAHRRSPGFGVSAATVGGILLIGIAVRLSSV